MDTLPSLDDVRIKEHVHGATMLAIAHLEKVFPGESITPGFARVLETSIRQMLTGHTPEFKHKIALPQLAVDTWPFPVRS